ncbi:MAG: VOC family protein [Phycisphaerae bacterium]
MTAPIPPGHEGLIPHLVVNNAIEAMEFYRKAFGADEICRLPSPDGTKLMHAEMKINGNVFYLCDDFPEMCGGKSRNPLALGGTPINIHMYVEDCDAAIEKAANNGAVVAMPAADMFWGDRYGMVSDPYGHTWSFATHKKDMTPEEMAQAASKAFG